MGILEPFYERGGRRLQRRIGAEINKIKGLCECYREWKNFVGSSGFCTRVLYLGFGTWVCRGLSARRRRGRWAALGEEPLEHLFISTSS